MEILIFSEWFKIDTSKVNGIISSLAASTQLIGVTVSEFYQW